MSKKKDISKKELFTKVNDLIKINTEVLNMWIENKLEGLYSSKEEIDYKKLSEEKDKKIKALTKEIEELKSEMEKLRNPFTAKLTCKEVREIRKLRSEGMSARELADKYKVSPPSIRRLVRGESYKHC